MPKGTVEQEPIITPRGMATDPNPHQTAPDGSALEAKNVWFLSQDVVEPRPGALMSGSVSGSVGSYVVNSYAFEDDGTETRIAWRTDESGTTDGLFRGTTLSDGLTTEIQDADNASLSFNKPYYGFEDYEGFIFIVTDNAVRRIDKNDPTSAVKAGLPRPPIGRAVSVSTASGLNKPFDNNNQAAYKLIYRTTLSTGRIVDSAPSPTFYYSNTSGSSNTPTIRHYLSSEATAGLEVRLYRTSIVSTSINPTADEVNLVAARKLTATDISNGYVSIQDDAEDTERGESLYTNTSEQGAERAYYPPPVARCIKEFNGMMFYGNCDVMSPSLNHFALDGGGDSNYTVAITSGSTSFTFSTGSPSATGFYITDTTPDFVSDTNFQDYTYVANSGALSQAAINTTSNLQVILWSNLSFAGTNYFYTPTDSPTTEDASVNVITNNTANVWIGSDTNLSSAESTAVNSLAYLVSQDNPDIIVEPAPQELQLDSRIDGTDQVGAFFLSEPRHETGAAITSQQADLHDLKAAEYEQHPARLYFSELRAPDHVPLINQLTIGEPKSPILGLGRTRDSLFVFKTDGVFRVTGSSPTDVSVDEFDRTLRLVNPRALVEADDAVYAFTNRGVVRVTESGTEYISRGLIDGQLFTAATEGIENVEKDRAFMGTWTAYNYVFLGVPSAGDDDGSAEYVWAYSYKTNQWSRWKFDEYEVFHLDESVLTPSRLLISGADSTPYVGNMEFGGLDSGNVVYADKAEVINNGVAPTFVANSDGTRDWTLASTSGWSVGDLLFVGDTSGIPPPFGGDEYLVVTEVFSGTGVLRGLSITSGAVAGRDGYITRYSGISWEYELLVRSAKNPGIMKRWHQIQAIFSSLKNTATFKVATRSSSSNTESSITHYLYPDTSASTVFSSSRVDATDIPRELRSSVSRDHTYASQLRVKFSGNQANAAWKLNGIYLTYDPVTSRGGRGR